MNQDILLLTLCGLLVLTVIVIYILNHKKYFPEGTIVYEDLGQRDIKAQPLYSQRYRLRGKPDQILEKDGKLIPIEIKHANGGYQPYKGHKMQLAAYCLLIDEHYGIRPEYGIIQYRNKSFEIPYTEKLKNELLMVMDDIRSENPAEKLAPICKNAQKCVHCGYQKICGNIN